MEKLKEILKSRLVYNYLNTLIDNFTGNSVFICQKFYRLTLTRERGLDRAIGINLTLPVGFKGRYRIQAKDFKHHKYKNDRELAKYVYQLFC